MALKFVCIVGSTRDGRIADRIMKIVQKQFDVVLAPNGHSLAFIDPLEYELPLVKKPLHFHQDWSEAPEQLRKLNDIISSAHGFFIITPEYNASLPPALTNLIDHIPPASFEYKPSGLISYSVSMRSGLLACFAARPFLSEIGCLPVKQMTNISTVGKEINEEGETENPHIVSSLKKLFLNVEWWADATKTKREKDGIPE